MASLTAFFSCVAEDLLKTEIHTFVKHVDAAAIVQDAWRQGIIPEKVMNIIRKAESQREANHNLFHHLCLQATVEDLRKLCSIMKEAKGYSNMIFYGETLLAKLDKVSS